MSVGSSPRWGTSGQNGAHGANARAEVPTYSPGRRAPSCVSQDGESLGTGGQAALPPDPGWPPTLPRCRDPGIGGDPVRAIRRPAAHLVSLGTLERLHPWLPPCEENRGGPRTCDAVRRELLSWGAGRPSVPLSSLTLGRDVALMCPGAALTPSWNAYSVDVSSGAV